ncbi:hypothetical protein [Streptomyces sp. ISID311]|uniref:hypothetical protein n=1 Tax=Streptomyces sp. ISID311 TaxID=2601673 RepID=UPI0011BD339B|nr:hypothetical protein [Streptomyces sp. ISID311]TXC99043.1 hypothetical protein FS847_06575 [Streptomyces sp. ISID311]
MNAEDFKGDPADRELYLRLLIERDGPPINALIERDPGLTVPRDQNNDAQQHLVELEAAISQRPRRRAA